MIITTSPHAPHVTYPPNMIYSSNQFCLVQVNASKKHKVDVQRIEYSGDHRYF